jgi:hypothetical protein
MKENGLLSNTKLMVVVFLIAGVLVGGSAAYLGMNNGDISKQQAGQMVADTLANSTGTSYEVVKVESQNGLYHVRLSVDNQLQSYYVTKNGKMLATQMTDLEQARQTINQQNRVSQCLQDKGAVLYGNVSQQPTVVQIQVLGGAQNVANVYKDVNNPQNLQEAADRGVTSVPTFWMNGETLNNVNNLNQISEFADCS